jgi:nicotinate-nucleotide adenylyltransferase
VPVELATSADRLQMLNLAIGTGAGLKISDVELNRSGPSYTIDTVHYFKQALPAETRLHLIMGLDAFLEIDTWKSFKDLLTQIPLIVINRPNAGSKMGGVPWKIIQFIGGLFFFSFPVRLPCQAPGTDLCFGSNGPGYFFNHDSPRRPQATPD